MTSFAGRFVAHVVAITLVPMAAVTVAAPGVGSAQCDPNCHLTLRDQFGAVRPELVTQCVDERMQTATATARLVHTQAGICAVVRTGGHPAATSTAAVGAAAPAPPGMGWRP